MRFSQLIFIFIFVSIPVGRLFCMENPHEEMNEVIIVPSLKELCINTIDNSYAEIPEEDINYFVQLELDEGLLHKLCKKYYDFAMKYAEYNDLTPEIADVLIDRENIKDEIVSPLALANIFPEKVLKGKNNKFLAWALFKKLLERAGNEDAKKYYASPFLKIKSVRSFEVDAEDALQDKHNAAQAGEGILHFALADTMEKSGTHMGNNIVHLNLLNNAHEKLDVAYYWPREYNERLAYSSPDHSLLLVAGASLSIVDRKELVRVCDLFQPHYSNVVHVSFPSNSLVSVTFYSQLDNIYYLKEFKIPDFRNLSLDQVAQLFVSSRK